MGNARILQMAGAGLALLLQGWLPDRLMGQQEPFTGKIGVIAVGYDIAGNAAARNMLEAMAAQARKDGANGQVILADKEPAKLAQALNQAFTSATSQPTPPVATAKPALTLKKARVRPGETIAVTHSDFPVRSASAWIGFYRAGADDKDYIRYTFLKNLTGRLYDVAAPDEPGQYEFRIYADEGYTPLASSPPVEVK